MATTETRHQSTHFLNRLIIMLAVLLLVYISIFSWQSWRNVKITKIQELESLMEVEEKAIDTYFTQIEDDLNELGQELVSMKDHSSSESAFFDSAFVLVKQFTQSHTGLLDVTLIRADGQILLSGKIPHNPTLPMISDEPSFNKYHEESLQNQHLNIGRPKLSVTAGRWITPLRYEVRNLEGKTYFILSDNLPVELLQNFWKEAPFTRTSNLAIIRDDGFLVSRYPVTARLGPNQIYGKPRTGALISYLKQNQFPDHGYTEGFSSLDGINYLRVFRRLDHFPVTLFVETPLSVIHATWWNTVKVPYLLLAILFAGGFFIYRHAYHQQRILEEKLSNSKAFLDRIIEQSPAPTLIFDTTGKLVRINQSHRDWLGTRDEERRLKYNILEDDQIEGQGFMPHVREVFEKGTATRFVLDYDTVITNLAQDLSLAKTKHAILDTTVSAVTDSGGRITHVIAQYQDISKQKQAEDALCESEERYRTVANFTYDWEYWISPDRKSFIYCSPSCERITGYRAEEFEKNPDLLKDIIHPDDRDQFIHHLSHLDHSEFESHEQEIRIVTRSGSERWIAHACCAVYSQDGTFLGRRACNRDITDRKMTEEKVHELNRDFTAFLENTTDFVFFKNANGRYRFCSQAMAVLTGHASWHDTVGKHTLEIFPEETGQIYNEEDLTVVREGRALLNNIDPYYDTSGNKGWLNTCKWPLRNEDGQIDGIFGIGRVVTELVELQDSMLELLRKNYEALNTAGNIQRSLLPKKPHFINNKVDFAWKFKPCDAIGGDIFNFIPLDADHIGIFIVDIAGHGLPSAMISFLVYQILDAHTGILVDHTSSPPKILDPVDVLDILNNEFPLSRFERHFTIIYAVLDTASNTLTYSNAGHCAPLIIMPRENDLRSLAVSGTVIGVKGFPFKQETVTLSPGDKVVFFSDGVIETWNTSNDIYGEERLCQTLWDLRYASMDDIVQGVYTELMRFADSQPTADDISILAFKIE